MRFFIIGYMASGKTTFGSALADRINVPFVDLDHYIEEKEGKDIREIFTERGEDGFRELERTCLHEVAERFEHAVIACGGGTPCNFDNAEYINENGISIFMETSIPVLITRLLLENDKRPLMAGLSDTEIRDNVLTQLCERLPYYLKAKLKWNGDELETWEEISSNVENFIMSYPSIFR